MIDSKTLRALASFAVLAAPPAFAQTVDIPEIDRLIAAAVQQKKLPGLSVGVMHRGKVLLVKGYGSASLASREPVTSDTMFAIGSVTKQFTCVLALQLADEGKLSMDDRVAKYFPGAARGGEVTLLDLGNHVSGYRDYYPLDFPDRAMSQPRAAPLVIEAQVAALDFDPGTQYSYSNTGFLMLGEIIERVSAEPLERILQRRVFSPLDMRHTAYQPAPGGPGMAIGYGSFALGSLMPATLEGRGWLGGAGAMWSTPTDMLSWSLALMDGRLLPPATRQVMVTARRLANGRSTNYGCGMGLPEYDGIAAWSHGGAVAGFTSRATMIPSSKSAIVLLTNIENSRSALSELNAAIARKLTPPRPSPAAVAGAPAVAVATALISQIQSGGIDRTRLSEEFNAFLTPARLQSASAALQSLGKLKSAELTSVETRGGMEDTTVLLKFDTAAVEASMFRSADGLVQQFLVYPK